MLIYFDLYINVVVQFGKLPENNLKFLGTTCFIYIYVFRALLRYIGYTTNESTCVRHITNVVIRGEAQYVEHVTKLQQQPLAELILGPSTHSG